MSSGRTYKELNSKINDFPEEGKIEWVKSLGGYLRAWGKTVPADGSTEYAPGCIFSHVDGGDDTAVYINEGTATSSDFNALTPS